MKKNSPCVQAHGFNFRDLNYEYQSNHFLVLLEILFIHRVPKKMDGLAFPQLGLTQFQGFG